MVAVGHALNSYGRTPSHFGALSGREEAIEASGYSGRDIDAVKQVRGFYLQRGAHH